VNLLILLILLVCPPQVEKIKLNLTHTTSFVVFPQDTNANTPMLFGGKILAEMDRCAGITTRRLLYDSKVKTAVTVAIKDLTFHKTGEIKDLIFVTGTVTELGSKSIKIHVKAEKEVEGRRELLVDGYFIFCAFDTSTKKAVEHGLSLKE
jgi:acyl-CoA hydrolase